MKRQAYLTAALLGILGFSSQLAADEPAKIVIDASKIGAEISPTLYGLFFEEINHAGDGGLYAELIQNRSFDETIPVEGCTIQDEHCVAPDLPCYRTDQLRQWKTPWKHASPHPAWSLENGDAAAASIQTDRPLHPNNPTYLRLEVNDPARARLLNEGYWGISVVAGETYDLSFFARTAIPKLRVGLIDSAGKVLASCEINSLSKDWTQHRCKLVASATEPKAHFFLEPQAAGMLDLDFVSLFPQKTFKNRPNGCRPDLAQLLADLKPAFVRFPGGCVVEGATMENRWQWKKTIGPVHTRPGHWSLWGYRNTDGLGYHEFLQLCEDIGAKGMWVINCGLSCEGRNGDFWPDERLPELIQDTLDGIEYAIGPADSKWGRLRAEAGHPAPLPLKYIEIGNENHGPRYLERYHRFAEAIKSKWPQITLICNVKIEGTEMEDPHFYVAPAFFFENQGRFDKSPRTDDAGRLAPRVYVGEFAVNREVGSGNLTAALAEAAFMMGFERNGDLVKLCSYAPLFFNVHDIRWPVNMIGYDSAVSFGRTSYYAQKMFAANLADVNLACEVAGPEMRLDARPGRVGLGTWNTQAEFKDIRVVAPNGKVLYQGDFSKPLGGFKAVQGDWKVEGGALRQTGKEQPTRALVGDKNWREYTVSLKARKLAGAEGFLVMIAADERGKSWWNLGGWGNKHHGLEIDNSPVEKMPGTIETGRWYDIRIEVAAGRVQCFLDGKLIHDVDRRKTLPSLYAVAGKKIDTGEIILKVVNAAAEPRAVQITTNGAALRPDGLAITMASTDATAENSVESPRKITPVESAVKNAGADFTHEFPAHSITVLRLMPR